jgi:hypothetical protein
MGYRARRTDGNHRQIADVFLKLGFSVLDIHTLPDCGDLLVARDGHSILIEIKDGSKPPSQRKLRDNQREFRRAWKGAYEVVETVDDALALSNRRRTAA